jgi:hypothetical protein
MAGICSEECKKMLAKVLVPKPADWAGEYDSTKGHGNWEKQSWEYPQGNFAIN